MLRCGADQLRVQGAACVRGAVHGESVVQGVHPAPSPPSLVTVRCHLVVTILVSNLVQKTRPRHQIPAVAGALDKHSPLGESGRRNADSRTS